MRLTDKVAVITGGAQGIGQAYARRFVQEGAKVVIGDIQDERGAVVVGELVAEGGAALYRYCDVTRQADTEALMKAAVDSFGGLDICVANAGLVSQQQFLEVTEDEFDRVMEVNVTGVFLAGQAAARKMVALGRGGAIINISSVSALLVDTDRLTYSGSKAGVNILTKSMAISLSDYGIRVNAIAPGATESDMLREIMARRPEYRANIEARTALRRAAQPEEMAGLATFLASDEASYVTGQILYNDGGRLPLNHVMPPRGEGAP